MFSKQFISTLCLIGASLIWGTAFVAQTTGMEYVGPLTFTNIRFIIGGLLVFPFAIKEFNRFNNIIKKRRLILITDMGKTTMIRERYFSLNILIF